MATADRVLSILGLFSIDRPEWTVEEIISELSLSGSTAYKYVRSLVSAGLLVSTKGSRYTIGPAVIELDRLTRRFDPLIHAAGPALRALTNDIPAPSIGLLCRLYRLTVICVDQVSERAPSVATSYERGRPMPLERGSASKIILANLPSRPLRRFYDAEQDRVMAAGLGHDWASFKDAMRAIRRAGLAVTRGELDQGVMGISAPVFGADGVVMGSIGLVLQDIEFASDQARLDAAQEAVWRAGKTVTATLRA